MGCGMSSSDWKRGGLAIGTGGLSEVGRVLEDEYRELDPTGSRAAEEAAIAASKTQETAAGAGIEEQRRQFDAIVEMMAPYLEAGTGALTAQQELAGLGGPEAQQMAIQNLQASPQYEALTQAGEEAILQRGSATGGLRGGDIQGALAQFRPQMLSQLIESQYGKLSGLSGLGQATAVQQAGAGQATGASIANLLQQQGAATAGGQLAAGARKGQDFQTALGIGGVAAGLF